LGSYLSGDLTSQAQSVKRTPLLISAAVILIIIAGIWIYQSTDRKKLSPWDLISKDATLVLELTNLNSLKSKLGSFPAFKKATSSNWNPDRIISSNFLQNSRVFIAVQPTSKDEFEFLIYTEINSLTKREAFSDLTNTLRKDLEIRQRMYNGEEITEFLKKGEPMFSLAVVEDIAIISGSSFLLEGALRLRTADRKELFKNSNGSLFKLPTLQSDEGNVYVSVSNFIEFGKLFIQPTTSRNQFLITASSLSDIKLDNGRLLLNGFVVNDEFNFLTLFEQQQPQSMDMEFIVSNRTAALVHVGLSNNDKWFADQEIFLKKYGIMSTDSLQRELIRLSVNIESIRKSVGNQFATCYLRADEGPVNILKLNDKGDQVSVFDELATKISTQRNDSLYVENYAGYEIKLIDYPNFLFQLLYPLAPISQQTYFTRVGQYLLMSENVELLKVFIDDMDDENTWGKSVDWNNFLSSSLQESNLNVFFDGKLVSVFLKNRFNSRWKPFFDSTNFLGIEKGSAQLSRLESNFYLNAALQFSDQQVTGPKKSFVGISYDVGNRIISPVAVVKSHVSKDMELIIQDSTGNIHLLSKDLKAQWKHQVGGRIIDGIKQVDFFANGKLQYFFTTDKSIHIIDRLGRSVDGFPQELALSPVHIEYSTVVDYDKSKKYRYLITDIKGNLYLTDKNTRLLEGWNPKVLGTKMFSSARHYRILGKDYFLAIQQNGTGNLMNRRGELARGFPMQLGFRPSGDFAINVGNSLSSTYFTVVSSEGIGVQFGLDGQIRKREVLLKRSGSSQFKLTKSADESSFIFLRTDSGKIAIIDSGGKILFEVENPGSANWQLYYIENRLKERFYCLYDSQQNFSYVFDGAGSMILPQPIESTQLPTLFFDEKSKSLSIYNVFNSRLSLVPVPR